MQAGRVFQLRGRNGSGPVEDRIGTRKFRRLQRLGGWHGEEPSGLHLPQAARRQQEGDGGPRPTRYL